MNFKLVDTSIIFAVNDPFKGPTTLLFESTSAEKDPSLALKVPVKAQLTLSLMDKDANIKVADAVLPFPDLGLASFSFLFTMQSDKGHVTASISYLVPQSENMSLYKKIPELKEKLNYLLTQMQNWQYKSGSNLPKSLYETITGILLYETDQSYNAGDLSSLITSEKSTGAPDYQIKKITKYLEHLFFELYVGRPVIVVGKSRINVEYAMATLDFFTPNKNLRKIIFSEQFIDPAPYIGKIDVFGISSVHEKKYKDYLIVDCDKFEIKNAKGKKEYFKRFMDDIIRIPASSAIQDIVKFIVHLDERVHEIEKLAQQNSSEDSIKEYLKSLNYDEASALTEIASISNLPVSNPIRLHLSRKLASWIEELR